MTTVGSPQSKTDEEIAVIRVVMLNPRAGRPDQRLTGADACLTVPFSPAALLDVVRSAPRTELAT